ncbi:MAG: hypothetical protein ACTSRN_01415 [Alphaproteobacteria bacterium]
MTQFSQEQQELQASIKKSATIWAVVLGLITAGMVYWIMASTATTIRGGAAVLGGAVVAFAMYRKSFKSGSQSARCSSCDAAFSISRTDKVETLVASENKDEREAQEDGTTKVTTWVEEKYDVTDTYTCSACSDATTKEYQTTRRKDEKTEVIAAPVASASKGRKQSKSKGKTK